jgi:hypothetical protein
MSIPSLRPLKLVTALIIGIAIGMFLTAYILGLMLAASGIK